MLELIKKRKRNWLGHWLRRNCLLKDVLEGMVNGKKVRDRRIYQMIDKIRGATAPKSQDLQKRLLPDGSTCDLVVNKALIPQI